MTPTAGQNAVTEAHASLTFFISKGLYYGDLPEGSGNAVMRIERAFSII